MTQTTVVCFWRGPRCIADARAVRRPLRIADCELAFGQPLLFFLINIEQPKMRHLDVVIDHHRVVLDLLAILFVLRRLIDCGQYQTLSFGRKMKAADATLV